MPADLRAIHTFKELTRYLEDELDWPLDEYGFDDLTFSYDPPELGLKEEDAAKVRTIHQLRPFQSNQPWGIFFVEFEKKNLPVVVLRRILRHLVLKKRASSDDKRWQSRDLLFISAWGEGENREMTFAHFVDHPDMGLAELRVLGWDDDDTPLHMDYIARRLGEKLRWRDDFAADPESWRKQWSDTFVVRHRHVITKSDELATALAALAQRLRNRIRTILRMEDGFGEIRTLQRAFKAGLIHDLDDDGFADMFAQTVTYGLFSVSVRRTFPGEGTALVKDDVPNLIFTSPFLKEMLGVFLGIKSRKGAIDFDELGISDVTDLLTSPDTHMELVLADFNNKTRGDDPVIHFYEHFLGAYNKKLKIQRGVFYTPQPVVSYIVRSVHELLQTEFGLVHGLADTTTWGEMISRSVGVSPTSSLKLPDLSDDPSRPQPLSENEPFVQILDPATGTATFPVEVIDIIHKHLKERWRLADSSKLPGGSPHFKSFTEYWNHYVPNHLLPRLHAFELMMAPYAIAHMKIGLKLAETGYTFATEERARIYLTNALEPKLTQLPTIGYEALAHEAAAVNEIKWNKRFTVVIGNPPYSIQSQNLNEIARAWVDDYRKVAGVQIVERNALQFEKNIQDDYIKFIRFSQVAVDTAGNGIVGMVTSHGFLDGATFRGMRWSLLQTFSKLWVLDLHGNSNKKETSPDGMKDENVFDISQGVAVSLFLKSEKVGATGSVNLSDLWGSRSGSTKGKYRWLTEHSCRVTPWNETMPTQPLLLFKKSGGDVQHEYETYLILADVMPLYSMGIKSSRDELVLDFEPAPVLERIERFRSAPISDEAICEQLGVPLKKGWNIAKARKDLRALNQLSPHIQSFLYRPLDPRPLFYHRAVVFSAAYPVMQHLLSGKNLAFVATRQTKDQWDVQCSRALVGHKSLGAYDANSVFPLYLVEDTAEQQQTLTNEHRINFAAPFLKTLASVLDRQQKGSHGLPADLTPEDIFHYIYAVFHSPGYRSRYAEFLKIDFPRLPLTGNLELFRELSRLGGELVALHLLEFDVAEAFLPVLPHKEAGKNADPTYATLTEFIGPSKTVLKPGWTDGTVWLDSGGKKAATTPGTSGFHGVPENVWHFHIGGYQVCAKWLKDRKGRTLTAEDIAHYHKIVIALSHTIRLMAEIDQVIETHGGWPGAFQSVKSPQD